MGNCNQRAVTPPLIDLATAGLFPDRREEGWIATVLDPAA